MGNSLQYVPSFDATSDTFDEYVKPPPIRFNASSLRRRSPFAVSVIVMVGAKIENASREPTAALKRLCAHAETTAKSTLFTPVSKIEVVQSMSELRVLSGSLTLSRPGVLGRHGMASRMPCIVLGVSYAK